MLFLICSISIGAHFGKHSLSGLIAPVLNSLHINTQQYGWLYSVQDFPGIFLPLLSGYVSLFLEPAIAALLFSILVFGGQTLCIIGIICRSFIITLTGKALFGLGDGALTVMQGIIIAKHFKTTIPKEQQHSLPIGLGTAYGTMIAVSRVTTMSSVSIPPFIAQHQRWGGYDMALWLSVCVSGFSVLCSFIYFLLQQQQHHYSVPLPTRTNLYTTSFSRGVIYTVLLWMLVSSSLFGFLHFSSDIFVSEFHISIELAALLNAVITLCACVLSPLLGRLQDRIAHPKFVLFLSCVLLCFAMTMFWWLLYSHLVATVRMVWTLLLPCLCLGIAFAVGPVVLLYCLVSFTNTQVTSVLACSVQFLNVKKQGRGFVLGVYKAMENVGLLFTQPLVG